MVKSPYCKTAQRGGICADSTCSKLHDVIRCEPCNCSFPSGSLQQHESGRQHLQNVASRRSRPSAPSQTASTIQPALPSNISPPAGGNTSTWHTDPRGRAILPGRPAINGDGLHNMEDMEDGEGTGINVSHDFGLEFSIERPSSSEPFATQAKELIITKSSRSPSVSFITHTVRSPDDSVTE
jgi:hypothetical protein